MAFYTNHGHTNSKPWINTSTRGRNHRSFTVRNPPNNNLLRAKETRFPCQNGSFNGTCQKQISHNSNRRCGSITCFRCGGPNHKADGFFASNEEADQYKAFAAIKIGETAEDLWYSDTGANQHMSSNTNEVQGTLEQNGLAKRRHRHIVETGLTLLSHASVPIKFWTAAFRTAVFLINRLPTSVLGYKSPHEVVFGSAPTYDSFRVFGCSCYPLLAPFGRLKLDFKSTRCVFLGYSTNHKGYICFEPWTHCFYISCHVKFNELQFPYKCMQPPDTHASQLFQIKALPRLLKTVAEKSIATATQVSSHDPTTIVPHTETAQEASASQSTASALLSQSAASASLSSSTAVENPVPPVISLASAPPSQRQHHMITRT
ncbi:PREDICTED: uncharacterized protein LOC105116907 isoform X2 [Populus euphratica]|nr:PREDICTED: uncharacterized protein LOC105116907 isoform X2 [Populus euphratica]XP_011012712.1 PREDICTED: uncharacterized protein LOC105116907 isoform X2 [Populus euphratica]